MLCCCPQIIYVAREAKDVAVSYYHHYRLMTGYTGSCEDFIEAFVAEIGKTICRFGTKFLSPAKCSRFYVCDKELG